jgi:hypothetical protein
MNSDSNKLVTLTYPPLTGAYGPLTDVEFDTNNLNTYKDLKALSITSNVPDYVPVTIYNNDYTDSATEHYAMYNGRLWMWVNPTPNSGVTPVAGASWQEVFPTILSHEKNKDQHCADMVLKIRVYQTGTSAPVVVEYLNPYGFTITTSYDGAGIYRIIGLTGELMADTTKKYEIKISSNALLGGMTLDVFPSDNESIVLRTYDPAGNLSDGVIEELVGPNAVWNVITVTKYS